MCVIWAEVSGGGGGGGEGVLGYVLGKCERIVAEKLTMRGSS